MRSSASCRFKNSEEAFLSEPTLYVSVQNWAGDLISGNTATGRFLVIFAFGCSMAAFGIYVYGERGSKKGAAFPVTRKGHCFTFPFPPKLEEQIVPFVNCRRPHVQHFTTKGFVQKRPQTRA